MPTTYEIVKDAIQNKKIIHAIYKSKERIMCPHCLGTKGSRQQTLFYQFAGESSTGLQPDGSANNWRCLFIDELSNVWSEAGNWHTAPNHSRLNTCVDNVDVEITD